MTNKGWLNRQLAEQASDDRLRPSFALPVAPLALEAAFEVGAPAAGGDDDDGRDRSFITPRAGDGELAAMAQPGQLCRELDLADLETRAKRLLVGEDAAEAGR